MNAFEAAKAADQHYTARTALFDIAAAQAERVRWLARHWETMPACVPTVGAFGPICFQADTIDEYCALGVWLGEALDDIDKISVTSLGTLLSTIRDFGHGATLEAWIIVPALEVVK